MLQYSHDFTWDWAIMTITQAQADEIGRILVREYETNQEFRAHVDRRARLDAERDQSDSVPIHLSFSKPGRPARPRGALAASGRKR